ncbi:hypothetical protein Tco_1192218 [Tanacetum coccineum]
MARFKELKTHLEFLHNTNSLKVGKNIRPYEIAFRIFFQEEYETFRMKMIHNLNQLQWQLESKYLHIRDQKSFLDELRTSFKKFFDSKEVNALDFNNRSRQKNFKDYTRHEPETYRWNLLRSWKNLTSLLQESLSTNSIALDASLIIKGAVMEACLVTKGIAMDDNLVNKERTNDSVTSSEQLDECNNSVEQKDTISSYSNSEEQHMQQLQLQARSQKEMCIKWFRDLQMNTRFLLKENLCNIPKSGSSEEGNAWIKE